MRTRAVGHSIALAILCATAWRPAAAQAHLAFPSRSVAAVDGDSTPRGKSRRPVDARSARGALPGDSTTARRADDAAARVTLSAVTLSGKPGSLEVVGVPIPSSLDASTTVRYRIVPDAGVRVLGRTQGMLIGGMARPSALMITLSAPASAGAGRLRVASAQFDGPAGSTPLEVPIEMTVLAVRRVEVTVVDQLVGARRGDVATIRYRAVNFGNLPDSVTVSAELPIGWRLASGSRRSLALPVRAARDGVLRLLVPSQAPPGTSMVRVVATSQAGIVAATDVRVEVENPNALGSQQGSRLSLGTAVGSLADGSVTSAYLASLEGQLSDSMTISARGAWRRATPGAASSDLALMRVGVPLVPPSLAINSPAFQLGLGLTGSTLSDLTGSFLSGTGMSAGTRFGGWKLSGLAARPYAYGQSALDSAVRGAMANARVEHAVGSGTMSVTATHLVEPGIARELDAASLGAVFGGTTFGDLSSELGYRRYAAGSGLGWSAELRRQGDNGSLTVRTMHAPGGAQAFARATDDLSAAGSRRLGDWLSMNAAFWRTGDGSSVFGSSGGNGWSAGPTFTNRPLGATLTLQGRGSSIDVSGPTGSFGSSETEVAALLDVHRGALFANGSGSAGRIARTVSTLTTDLPALTGGTMDVRGSIGALLAGGTIQVDAGTQRFAGSAGILPRRTTMAARADHIAIPLGERLRVYAGAVFERLGFSTGGDAPFSSRYSLTVPLGFGLDVTASAERNPFLSAGIDGGHGGWITAVRIDRAQFLPRLFSPGETHHVFRDLNGNGVRDAGESGVSGLVVRCGTRSVTTDRDGRFKCQASEQAYVDPQSLPAGWLSPGIKRERITAGDIGLMAITAVKVHVVLVDVDTLRVPRHELEKLVVVARDSTNQPWLARDLGAGELVFDALPAGRYTIEVDASAIEEPLKMTARPEFMVGAGAAAAVDVALSGRALKVRVLPPTHSGGAGPTAAANATRDEAHASSKENRQ